ncbi:hypothetical protein K3172_13265 [Qipengyuania sp. 6B39]|uniref:hypothetical protein n=1 Tax=Qipengyuania proteolytica TaxID=2867239 RepID=UPI001C8902C0|nr:hypothetical protein [Qipengyuania proteolytica]MBX7496828.1 hypothetical protein [Qipengyuania proteolytica]
MNRIRLSIQPEHGRDADRLEIEAPDTTTALLIADINVHDGFAELWDGKRLLGRVIKHGGAYATFWEIA